MNDTLRALLPMLGMFLGLFSVVRYYMTQLKNEIKRLEERIEILEQKKNTI